MINNMTDVVLEFAKLVTVRRVVQTIVNHKPANNEVPVTISATIVPAKPEDLQGVDVKFGVQYWKAHTVDVVAHGDILEYKGKDHKAVSVSDYSDNGFFKTIFEEIK